MQRTLVLFALLTICSASHAAVTGDFTLQWQQTLPTGEDHSEMIVIGDTKMKFMASPPPKKDDPRRWALFVGKAPKAPTEPGHGYVSSTFLQPATKTPLYAGKTYHLAIVRHTNRLQVFINGYPQPPLQTPVTGELGAWPNNMIITEKALSDVEILAHVKSHIRPREVITVGHRGDNRFAPENTNVSYVQCIDKHIPVVEMDLRLTKDNVLVLMHDATVDRTTDGTGKIVEMDLADAKKLDAGSWKDAKFKGEPIPLVADVVGTCRGKAIVMLDLKCTGLGQSIAEMKKQTNFPADQMILAPWEDEEGIALRKYLPDVPMIRLTSKIPTDNFDDTYFAHMKQIGFSGFSVDFRALTKDFIDAAHKNGFKIYTWTVNDAPEIAGAVLNNVDGIITDDPANTMKLIAELTSR